ncbi:MAG: HAMP domain-containing protein [Brevinematia bacterium]
MNKKKFRWRYFIDKPFQIRFILRFSVLILLGFALSFAVMALYKSMRFTEPLYFRAKMLTEEEWKKVDYNNPATYLDMKPLNIFEIYFKPLTYISILYILLIAIFGLFISHKLAGPVYRIKRTLQDAANGKMDIKDLKFRLRKKDELQDLVEALNYFIEKVAKK